MGAIFFWGGESNYKVHYSNEAGSFRGAMARPGLARIEHRQGHHWSRHQDTHSTPWGHTGDSMWWCHLEGMLKSLYTPKSSTHCKNKYLYASINYSQTWDTSMQFYHFPFWHLIIFLLKIVLKNNLKWQVGFSMPGILYKTKSLLSSVLILTVFPAQT